MKTFKHSLIALFLPLLLSASHQDTSYISESEKPATLKILLASNSDGVLLEARGPFTVINPENDKKLSSGRKGKRFFLYPHKEGIKWGEDFLGIYQIQILPMHPDSTILINGIQYRGSVEVYHIDGKLSIINEVDIESYLKSILPTKLSTNLTSTVIDALAIIERTNAYYSSLNNRDAFWHVRAKDVEYQGIGLTYQNLNTDHAVDNTRHLIMTYEDRPFPSTWTEHCAGKTASFHSIFRKNIDTPKGVSSEFAEKTRKETHWTFTIDAQELAKIIKTNRVMGINLFVDHSSGKIYALKIHDGAHSEDIDFITLQQQLGEDRLQSNDFSVCLKDHTVIFEGYGKGCGTGLCVFSASQMADKGDDTPKILADFFPCTHIEKMRSFPEGTPTLREKKKYDKKRKLLR
jgi:stage II sporulation protein D